MYFVSFDRSITKLLYQKKIANLFNKVSWISVVQHYIIIIHTFIIMRTPCTTPTFVDFDFLK